MILNPQRMYNKALDDNLTAITIFTSEHQKGSRTYGVRNIKRSVSDAKNLKSATAKDITFLVLILRYLNLEIQQITLKQMKH